MRANTEGMAATSTVGASDDAAPRPVRGESLIPGCPSAVPRIVPRRSAVRHPEPRALPIVARFPSGDGACEAAGNPRARIISSRLPAPPKAFSAPLAVRRREDLMDDVKERVSLDDRLNAAAMTGMTLAVWADLKPDATFIHDP